MKKVILTPNPYRDRDFSCVLQAKQILERAGVETAICLSFDVDKSYAYRITSNDIGREAIIFDTRQAEAIKQQESVERDKLYGNEQCM